MKKTILATSICLLLLLSLGLFAQDSKTDDPKTDSPFPQTNENTTPETDEPAKKYKIEPVFKKDMTWKEQVEYSMSESSSYRTTTGLAEFTFSCKVTEMKDSKPAKIHFESKKAVVKNVKDYSDPTREDRIKTEEIGKTAFNLEISDSYRISKIDVETKSELTSDETQIFYPNNPVIGMILPGKEVSAGDEWSAGEVLPLNFPKEVDVEFVINDSIVKFIKVTTEEDVEIAEFSWTGNLTPDDSSEDERVYWERKILYDLTNQRIISTDTIFKPENEKMSIKISVEFEYPEVVKDDEPDKPKGEED